MEEPAVDAASVEGVLTRQLANGGADGHLPYKGASDMWPRGGEEGRAGEGKGSEVKAREVK